MVRSCEISVFRSILSLQIFIFGFENARLEIILLEYVGFGAAGPHEGLGGGSGGGLDVR